MGENGEEGVVVDAVKGLLEIQKEEEFVSVVGFS